MFKILDWQFANVMIGVGLSTEAVIFFLSSFEPKHEEMDWSKIYPELADGAPKKSKGDDVSAKLDDMLSKAKIGPELIESLGKGMQNLATSAEKMGNLSDAAVATNDYASNVKSAAKTLADMNVSYGCLLYTSDAADE